MVLELINKALMIILILSSLNIIRHGFFTVLAWVKDVEENAKYVITNRGLILLGVSIGYVITSIITGVTI
jgi:hypothetical protein